MFGYILLCIDQVDVISNNIVLFSYVLNFGVYIEGMDNSIFYVWKGLMGGYFGLFVLVLYWEKLVEYSCLENCDFWEYKLNFMFEEIGCMVEYVWEFKQVCFDYYFFDENCLFCLFELMEIVCLGIELIEQFLFIVIFIDIVCVVKNVGLIECIDYWLLCEKELFVCVELFDYVECDWVKCLVDDDSLFDVFDFKVLLMLCQVLIQDVVFCLVCYCVIGQVCDSGIVLCSYNLLCVINCNLLLDFQVECFGQLEDGYELWIWQFGVGSCDDCVFVEYGLCMVYYDFVDNVYGFFFGVQIEIGQFKLCQYEGNCWQLQNFDLVIICLLILCNQLFKLLFWQVVGGLEWVLGEDGDENLVSYLNGGVGGSWMFGDDLLFYVMGIVWIENNRDFVVVIVLVVGFDSGLLWCNLLGNLILEVKGDYFYNGEVCCSLGFVQQVELGCDFGLCLGVECEFSYVGKLINEVKLELCWYYY